MSNFKLMEITGNTVFMPKDVVGIILRDLTTEFYPGDEPRIPYAQNYTFEPDVDVESQVEILANRLSELKDAFMVFLDVSKAMREPNKLKYQHALSGFASMFENFSISHDYELVIRTSGEFWDKNVGKPRWANNYRLWLDGDNVPEAWWTKVPILKTIETDEFYIVEGLTSVEEFYREINWVQPPDVENEDGEIMMDVEINETIDIPTFYTIGNDNMRAMHVAPRKNSANVATIRRRNVMERITLRYIDGETWYLLMNTDTGETGWVTGYFHVCENE